MKWLTPMVVLGKGQKVQIVTETEIRVSMNDATFIPSCRLPKSAAEKSQFLPDVTFLLSKVITYWLTIRSNSTGATFLGLCVKELTLFFYV
jgi:hypothetical protein